MTPKHAVKNGKRYRYYVSRRLAEGHDGAKHEKVDQVWRLPLHLRSLPERRRLGHRRLKEGRTSDCRAWRSRHSPGRSASKGESTSGATDERQTSSARLKSRSDREETPRHVGFDSRRLQRFGQRGHGCDLWAATRLRLDVPGPAAASPRSWLVRDLAQRRRLVCGANKIRNFQRSLWANRKRMGTAKPGNRDRRDPLLGIGPELAVSGPEAEGSPRQNRDTAGSSVADSCFG